MARVTLWFESTTASRRHPSEVECGYQVVHAGGEKFLQLSTYGSDSRQSEKTVSQTLQLDAAAAAKLRAILDEVFPSQ